MGAAFPGQQQQQQQQPMMFNATQLGPNQTYYSPNSPQVCCLLLCYKSHDSKTLLPSLSKDESWKTEFQICNSTHHNQW